MKLSEMRGFPIPIQSFLVCAYLCDSLDGKGIVSPAFRPELRRVAHDHIVHFLVPREVFPSSVHVKEHEMGIRGPLLVVLKEVRSFARLRVQRVVHGGSGQECYPWGFGYIIQVLFNKSGARLIRELNDNKRGLLSGAISSLCGHERDRSIGIPELEQRMVLFLKRKWRNWNEIEK